MAMAGISASSKRKKLGVFLMRFYFVHHVVSHL
jgi:hypothetical protein